MIDQPKRRVVITGLGVVAPNGLGKEAFWNATSKGNCGIKPIHRLATADIPIQVAGEITNFAVEEVLDRKLANRTDRVTHFALAAMQEALTDASLVLSQENPRRVGAVMACSWGGIEYITNEATAAYTRGPRAMSAYSAIAWLQVANVGQASIRYGFQGYCKTPVNDTVGGLDALGVAAGAIRRGAADVILAGGCEAPLSPLMLLMLARKDYIATGGNTQAYRPFDRRAAGLVLAEGAGVCILEEYEHARQRGAFIYGEIIGYGQTNDAHGLIAPSASGKQYARAMSLAMQPERISPKEVGYFSLDGHAVRQSDQGEAEALGITFGDDLNGLPVSVPRTMVGHSYAAAGAWDAIVALLALQHRLIPPTINCDEPDPRYGLNLVRDEARPFSEPVVLLGGRGAGGANVVVAIRKF
jgi:3-oxoacyl-(acyl-carrier-protein) synthase